MSKQLLVAGLLVAATVAGVLAYHYLNESPSTSDIPVITKSDMTVPEYDSWIHWQNQHDKKYSSKEIDYRMSVYHYNYQIITKHQGSGSTFSRGINQFMDLTPAEFAKFYLGLRPNQRKPSGDVFVATLLDSSPSSVDWRGKGILTPVKNQGQCGSCWAFSTTGSVEGLYFQTKGSLHSFSEQQLVDCSGSYGNNGCSGGLMDNAFKYVEAKGLETESQYPYEGVDGTCKYKAAGDFKIASYKDVGGWFGATSADLKAAIAIRPVSIGVDAQKWSSYTGGIYDDCGTSLDHGVLAVGYTSDYWIVKNSWGASWGEEGFIRLKMGNTCGLLNQASYPTA